MESTGAGDRKLPPGIWGLSGNSGPGGLGGGEGRLTGGGGGGGRGAGLEEAEWGANRTAAGEGMDALGVSGSLPLGRGQAATRGPELLSIFQKLTEKGKNHTLVCNEDSEIK